MRIVDFIPAMSNADADIHKAFERFVQQSDSKQWSHAGIELGRMEQLAQGLAALCRLASNALWEESRRDREDSPDA